MKIKVYCDSCQSEMVATDLEVTEKAVEATYYCEECQIRTRILLQL